MMKNRNTPTQTSALLNTVLIVGASLGLLSCDSGVDLFGSDIAPQSLSDVTLDIVSEGGPQFTFFTTSPATATTPEGGTFTYTNPDLAGFFLEGSSFSGLDADCEVVTIETEVPVSWPETFENGTYRYSAVGDNTGRLEVWGDADRTLIPTITVGGGAFVRFIIFTENFLVSSTSADPILMDITFDTGAGSTRVASTNLILTTPVNSTSTVPDFAVPFEAIMTLNGALLPTGFDPDIDIDDIIPFEGDLNDVIVTLTEDGGSQLFFNFVSEPVLGSNSLQDQGNFSLTFSTGDVDPVTGEAIPNQLLAGEYTFDRIDGTAVYTLSIEFNAESRAQQALIAGTVSDGDISLDFGGFSSIRPTALGTVAGSFTVEDE